MGRLSNKRRRIGLALLAAAFIGLTTSRVEAATRLLDEGTSQGFINEINCVGAGVSCSRSGIRGAVTISGGGAPTDADYLVGTANASLSAEIVVGTTPGGELGGTWGSPTLDDSVAVTSWNLTTPTITTSLTTSTPTTISAAELDRLDGLAGTIVTTSAGTAPLSTALAANGANCSAGNYPLGVDASGAVESCTAAGGGSGTTSFPLFPYSAKLSGAYVTATITNLDVATQGAQIDAGDGNWRVLFDATTDEAVVFYGIIPTNYSSAPVINLIYSLTSATANEVEWEAAVMCVTPGDAADVGTASFAAGATSGGLTVPATAGHTDTLASITPTDDSCAANDLIYVYISTDADDATNDDATGDRELVGAYVSYT